MPAAQRARHLAPVAQPAVHLAPVDQPAVHLAPVAERARHLAPVAERALHLAPVARPAVHLAPVAERALHPAAAARRARHLVPVASGVAALAVLAAACSGGSGGLYGGGSTASGAARPAAVVDVRASTLGPTLVDGQGRTLYLFEADQANKSKCNGGCAVAWPPYVGGGTPRAGTGVTESLLGTTARGDGGTQVTYSGHPLYYYAGDAKPGDDAGQGLDQFGGKWYVLGPNGSKIDMD